MEQQYVVAQLDARLQPVHRGEFFEDPLAEVLALSAIGEVTGGGSLISKSGEIEYCDIEIAVQEVSDQAIQLIADTLNSLGAPKGSKLHVEPQGRQLNFGSDEGLAVYLNGTDLPDSTYAECDSNFVYSEFERLLAGVGRVLSFWQGPTETAFYMYGKSFALMKDRLEEFLATYPLCAQCRIEQIA